VFDGAGALVKDAGQVNVGEEISARVARGEIRASVRETSASQDTKPQRG
jgi:hypothetical protein